MRFIKKVQPVVPPLTWLLLMLLLWNTGLSAPVPALCATLAAVGVWAFAIPAWGLSGFWIRNALCAAYLVEAGFLITADIRYPGAGYGGASGILALLLVFSFFDARWLRSLLSAPKTPPIELQFPLAGGRFAVVQGGNDSTLNHHAVSAAQRYAIDIVSVGAFGMRASAIVPTRNGQYYAYGRDVLAPCDGQIAAAQDGIDDDGDATRSPFGNAVFLLRDDGAVVVLAHLQRGSVAVRTGERVAAGARLGRIGNSGRSSEPHLHIHVERNGIGVPMTFARRSLVRNAIVAVT